MPLETILPSHTTQNKRSSKWLPRQELLQLAYGEEFGKTGHHLAGHEVPLRWPGGDWYRWELTPKNHRAKSWFQCRLIYLALFENKVEVTSDLKLSQEIGTIFFSWDFPDLVKGFHRMNFDNLDSTWSNFLRQFMKAEMYWNVTSRVAYNHFLSFPLLQKVHRFFWARRWPATLGKRFVATKIRMYMYQWYFSWKGLISLF